MFIYVYVCMSRGLHISYLIARKPFSGFSAVADDMQSKQYSGFSAKFEAALRRLQPGDITALQAALSAELPCLRELAEFVIEKQGGIYVFIYVYVCMSRGLHISYLIARW